MSEVKSYIIPFVTEPQKRIAIVGKPEMGILNIPQYKMLLTIEKVEVEAAELWTVETQDRYVATLAKEIYDNAPKKDRAFEVSQSLTPSGSKVIVSPQNDDAPALSLHEYDRVIRELMAGYIGAEVPKDCADEEAFLAADFSEYEKRKANNQNLVFAYLVKINELSAQIAREEDRRYEVYATVIARHRIAGLEGIEYSDLNDAMKSPSLLVRLGLFGIYEDRGQLYEESAIGATEDKDATPAVPTPAPAPKTQDEVVKP